MNLILVFSYIGIPMEVTIKANTGVIRVQMRSDAQQLDLSLIHISEPTRP